MDDFLKYLMVGLVIVAVMLIVFNTDWSYAAAGPTSVVNASQVQAHQPKIIMEKASPVVVGQQIEEIFDTRTFGFDTSYLRDFKQYYIRTANLYSGLMFGNNDLGYDFDYPTEIRIEFTVSGTNHIAPLIVSVNDNVVSSEYYTKGSYSIDIPAEKLPAGKATLRIMAGSSSWKLWAPAIYNITDLRIMEKSMYAKSVEHPFYLQKRNYESVKLELHMSKNSGEISVMLNGHDLYSGQVSDDASISIPMDYLGTENFMKIAGRPDSDFSGVAKIVAAYRERTENNNEMAASFDLPTDSYDYLKAGGSGEIIFTVYHVDHDGIVNVKILAGENVIYNQYQQATGGEHVFSFDSKSVVNGGNRLVISAADGGLFTVKDVSITV